MRKQRWLDSEFNRIMLPADILMVLLPILAAIIFGVSVYAQLRAARLQQARHPQSEQIPPVRQANDNK